MTRWCAGARGLMCPAGLKSRDVPVVVCNGPEERPQNPLEHGINVPNTRITRSYNISFNAFKVNNTGLQHRFQRVQGE
jgi:hypothetical protein